MTAKNKKVLFLYNPYAGDESVKSDLDTIIRTYQAHDRLLIPLRVVDLATMEQFFSNIDFSSYTSIACAGGDGLINACVNAMMKHDVKLPIAIFPYGVFNVFASKFSYPKKLRSMLDVALHGDVCKVSIGKANDEYFINSVMTGAFAAAVNNTDRDLKNTLGPFAFYFTGIAEVLQVKNNEVEIHGDDFEYIGTSPGTMIECAGQGRIPGEKSADDEPAKLAVSVLKKMPRVAVIGKIRNSLLGGQLQRSSNVVKFSSDKVTIDCKRDDEIAIDANDKGVMPLKIELVHDAIEILVPEVKKTAKLQYIIFETEDRANLDELFRDNKLEFVPGETLQTDTIKLWKAEECGQGILLGGVCLAKREGEYVIDGIAVNPKFRGSGIGTALIETACNEVRKLGGNRVFLITKEPWPFKKAGFDTVRREDAPDHFECYRCPQYRKKCFPEVMLIELASV